MAEQPLFFDANHNDTYRLLELPPELLKTLEDPATRPQRLWIKGAPEDDAVLCTENKTYVLRSVVLSNSMLVTGPSTRDEGGVVIRTELHDVLELTSCLPRLNRLQELLLGFELGEDTLDDEEMSGEEDEEYGSTTGLSLGTLKTAKPLTYESAREKIQASDRELEEGMKTLHILKLRGRLYPISSAYLAKILELLLNTLASLSLPHQAAPVDELCLSLEQDHDVKREITRQVMSWFGDIGAGLWTMHVDAVLTQVGIGVLSAHRDEPIAESILMTKWADLVGDTFTTHLNRTLLAGYYIAVTATSILEGPKIRYYPRSLLPLEPGARFQELFSASPRWRADDIGPFLMDIAVDQKERDKLLLKYARAITNNGVWYTAKTKAAGT